MREIPQHTAFNLTVFLTDASDPRVGLTGATLTGIEICKDGGAFTSDSPTQTERDFGWYELAFTAADSDTPGDFEVHYSATGALDGERQVWISPRPHPEPCAATGTPTTTTVDTTDLLAGTANDFWADAFIRFVNGNAAGQLKQITGSSESGGTTTLTFGAMTDAASSGDDFVVINI